MQLLNWKLVWRSDSFYFIQAFAGLISVISLSVFSAGWVADVTEMLSSMSKLSVPSIGVHRRTLAARSLTRDRCTIPKPPSMTRSRQSVILTVTAAKFSIVVRKWRPTYTVGCLPSWHRCRGQITLSKEEHFLCVVYEFCSRLLSLLNLYWIVLPTSLAYVGVNSQPYFHSYLFVCRVWCLSFVSKACIGGMLILLCILHKRVLSASVYFLNVFA